MINQHELRKTCKHGGDLLVNVISEKVQYRYCGLCGQAFECRPFSTPGEEMKNDTQRYED